MPRKRKKIWIPVAPDGTRNCQGCPKGIVTHPRGLCQRCYYNVDIRHRYPVHSTRKCEEVDGYAEFVENYVPTATLHGPGSLEKMKIMSERLMAGISLFHPLDSRRGG